MKVWAKVLGDGRIYSGIDMEDHHEEMTVHDWGVRCVQLAGGVLRVLARQYEWLVKEEGEGEPETGAFIEALGDDAVNAALTMTWHDPD